MLLARGDSHCASMLPSRVCISQQPRSQATWSTRGSFAICASTASTASTTVAITAVTLSRAADDHHDCRQAREDARNLEPGQAFVEEDAGQDDGAGWIE